MVEFSQPNTHKAFHIGHVKGTSLGESISRILEFTGGKVTRTNYSGDTGMHIAKWIWCYQNFHKKEKISDDEEWIASIYVDAVKRLEDNKKGEEEVREINKKLDEKSDKELTKFWKETRKLSIKAWNKIYKELNTNFDKHFFESEVEEEGKNIVKDLQKLGIAEESEGAIIANLEKFKLGIFVLLRNDGTPLYSAKDLALAKVKFNKYKIGNSIYIVGKEQETYFYQLFKVLELMKFKQAKNCKYVPINEVRFPTGKMSSRTGDNILYSDFVKGLRRSIRDEIKKRDSNLSDKELEKRSLPIAIASLKYTMLKQDINKYTLFDKKEALSLEGNTGPYILYTYTRAKSILRKAKYKLSQAKEADVEEKEKQLILKLSKFPDLVKSAANQLSPNLIANYTYELAQQFNEYYHSTKVIGSDSEQFKLNLVNATSQVIKNGLNLLGIETLERM